ncbi:MAG: DUF58 domain-containing protein [Lachnospiraceae bacterium]|nr:DUF58 domain-containing protein [Lachnospiraceae bacterium]
MENIIFDDDFYSKLNTIKMSLSMRMSQGMSGNRKSTAKGSSVEFSDFREYMLGDDIRRIDWNAYGRTDKLYIKQFMEEKEGHFRFFLDTSASMDFGQAKKSVMALQITAALSYVILNNLDRVFINEMKGDGLIKGKGMAGGAAFSHLLNNLKNISFEGNIHISKRISSCSVPRGGVSFIVSDFLDPEGIEGAVKYLVSRKQTVVLVQVLAREEIEVDYEGTLNMLDMETGDKVKITMSTAAVNNYNAQLEAMRTGLAELSRKYGAHYVSIESDKNLAAVLLSDFSEILRGVA